MEQLQQIIPQLGYGFICSFWQMGLLYAFYKILAPLYLPAPAERFRLACLLAAGGTLWFLFTVCFSSPAPGWQVSESVLQQSGSGFTGVFSIALYGSGYIYLALLISASLKGHYQWKTSRRLMNSAQGKAPVEWRLFVDRYAGLLGIQKKVVLKISAVCSPATFGFLKPVILLPASCLTGLNPAQVQAILLHELAHIRRGDYLSAWLLQVAGILLHFNPFMRLLVQEARKECENACDDLVLQFEYNPVHYAQALLMVAKSGQPMAWALQAQGGSQQHLLLNRITRLLGQPGSPNRYFNWKNAAFFGLALTFFAGTQRMLHLENREMEKAISATLPFETGEKQAVKPWKQRVHEARLAILTAAAKPDNITLPAPRQVSYPELEENGDREARGSEHETGFGASFIPAAIQQAAFEADEARAEAELKELEVAWKQFNLLLEKLELSGDLAETEWRQIAGLITLHAEIRETVMEENKPAGASVTVTGGSAPEKESTGKILVIVHEETTGKLAASFMNPDEINEAYAGEVVPRNMQKVILLRKKNENSGKKIISL